MVTFTSNKGLGLPVVGGDAGAWGPPLNNNSSILDASLGGFSLISVSSVSGALTLLASNSNNVYLFFSGSITQNTVVTMPTIGSIYWMDNLTAGSSQFTLTVTSTGASASVIGLPPATLTSIFTASNGSIGYLNLPPVGTYWDYAGSSVPNWVTACSTPPWVNCDGTIISSVTYPNLVNILGGTTLPDSRGRGRSALNQGTGRLNSSNGVDGNTLLAAGGNQAVTLSSLHLPQLQDIQHTHGYTINGGGTIPVGGAGQGGAGAAYELLTTSPFTINSAFTGLTYGSSAQIGTPNVQPTYMGGITMVRAG